jgi:predicted nicotinamide N-methyase
LPCLDAVPNDEKSNRAAGVRVNRPILDRTAFIRANTRALAPPLVPEVQLYLAEESLPIWRKTEEELQHEGLPPPYWAFAWAGGQALARYVLDEPASVAGKRVLDLASGSGLVAIAAMQAGAASVLAADIDEFARAAIALNAGLNGVAVSICGEDLLAGPPADADIVLVGDLFYEKPLAERALAWLDRCLAAGAEILVGDPGRSYCPKHRLAPICQYRVPVTRELEDAEIKQTTVWRLTPRQ